MSYLQIPFILVERYFSLIFSPFPKSNKQLAMARTTTTNNVDAMTLDDDEGKIILFDIPGEPVAQRRPRVAYAIRQIYNPQGNAIKNLRNKLKQSLEEVGHFNPYPYFSKTARVSMVIEFNMERGKRH